MCPAFCIFVLLGLYYKIYLLSDKFVFSLIKTRTINFLGIIYYSSLRIVDFFISWPEMCFIRFRILHNDTLTWIISTNVLGSLLACLSSRLWNRNLYVDWRLLASDSAVAPYASGILPAISMLSHGLHIHFLNYAGLS